MEGTVSQLGVVTSWPKNIQHSARPVSLHLCETSFTRQKGKMQHESALGGLSGLDFVSSGRRQAVSRFSVFVLT